MFLPGVYQSTLAIRTFIPSLPRQESGTDFGIFTLLYQHTLSQRYGEAAGYESAESRITSPLNALKAVTRTYRVKAHRTWLRHTMHSWWPMTIDKYELHILPAGNMEDIDIDLDVDEAIPVSGVIEPGEPKGHSTPPHTS